MEKSAGVPPHYSFLSFISCGIFFRAGHFDLSVDKQILTIIISGFIPTPWVAQKLLYRNLRLQNCYLC